LPNTSNGLISISCISEKSITSCDIRSRYSIQRRSFDFEIKDAKVFGTCNEINQLSKPLQSRFRRLHLPPYTKEQFLDIAVKVCPKLKEETSRMIGEEVWNTDKDVRDVVSLSKLIRKSDGPDEIEAIMRTLTKYC